MFQVFLFWLGLLGGKTKIIRHPPIEWALYWIVCIASNFLHKAYNDKCFIDYLNIAEYTPPHHVTPCFWHFALMQSSRQCSSIEQSVTRNFSYNDWWCGKKNWFSGHRGSENLFCQITVWKTFYGCNWLHSVAKQQKRHPVFIGCTAIFPEKNTIIIL